MARIGYPDETGLSEPTRSALTDFGVGLNVNRMISNADGLAPYVIRLAAASFARTTLTLRCRELVVLATARRSGHCPYALTQHRPAMRRLGLDPDEILGRNLLGLAETERALYESLASRDDCKVWSPETVHRLGEHFTDRQILEILILEGIYSLYASIVNDLDVEIDDRGEAIGDKLLTGESSPEG